MHFPTYEMISTIILAVFASTGFWTLINTIYTKRSDRKSVERKALLGLLHEQLVNKCEFYLNQGWISLQDYEDLRKYIFEPYQGLGGNGTGEALFNKVTNLSNKSQEQMEG